MTGKKRRRSRESLSAFTVNAYASALRRLENWLGKRPLDDERLAEYLDGIRDRGAGEATAGVLICAVRRSAHDRDEKPADGERTADAVKQFRREGDGRPGRGRKSSGMTAREVALLLTHQTERRQYGQGLETADKAARRGQIDRAIVSLLCHAGLRRSEVAVLQWRDIKLINAGDVRVNETRELRGEAAKAIQVLHRTLNPRPDDTVVGLGKHQVNRRFKKACAEAGLDGRTSHDGRVGLARALAAQGAPREAIQRAGGWKGPAMVRQYTKPAAATGGSDT